MHRKVPLYKYIYLFSPSPFIPSLLAILYLFVTASSNSPCRKPAERGSCSQDPVFPSGCNEMHKSDNHVIIYPAFSMAILNHLFNFCLDQLLTCFILRSGRCKTSFLKEDSHKVNMTLLFGGGPSSGSVT